MKNHRIADRYARVLLKQAEHDNQLDKVHTDLNHVAALLASSPELLDFINNPVIPVKKSQEVIEHIFKHKVNALTLTFLLFLAQKERLPELGKICGEFNRLYDELRNIVRARISSVCALRPDQVAVISEKLKDVFKKEIHVETHLDLNLLGGFKVQIRDLIYDYSIRTQLETYREAVMAS